MEFEREIAKVNPALAEAIWKMPKVELHLHLDGTLEPAMKIDIARRNGITLEDSTVEEIVSTYRYNDLPSFIASYNAAQEVMTTAEDFEDVAYGYLTVSAKQNVRHAEMFFDPQLHTSRGVAFESIVGGYRRAMVRAERDYGITSDLIMCFVRDFSAEHAMSTLIQSLPYRNWIVGVGMDSVEEGNPPSKFSHVFARARREGYMLTFHSDLEQVNQVEHLRQGIFDLKVDRVDHGLHVLDDATLLRHAQSSRIGFTATPLGYAIFTDKMRLPEIRALLKADVVVSVGSDDPAFFGGYIVETLMACAQVGGFTLRELVKLQMNAVESSWLPPRRKEHLRGELASFAEANRDLIPSQE